MKWIRKIFAGRGRREAIRFGEWLLENGAYPSGIDCWRLPGVTWTATTEALYWKMRAEESFKRPVRIKIIKQSDLN